MGCWESLISMAPVTLTSYLSFLTSAAAPQSPSQITRASESNTLTQCCSTQNHWVLCHSPPTPSVLSGRTKERREGEEKVFKELACVLVGQATGGS